MRDGEIVGCHSKAVGGRGCVRVGRQGRRTQSRMLWTQIARELSAICPIDARGLDVRTGFQRCQCLACGVRIIEGQGACTIIADNASQCRNIALEISAK